MLSPKLRADIRKLWDRFWSGGIANPLTAIEQLYRAHGALVFGFLRRRCGDADLAADLTQDTFVRAARARSGGHCVASRPGLASVKMIAARGNVYWL